MSYGIIRIQKFKASAVRGIEIHDSREKPSRTNPDIDRTRSNLNYDLVECSDFKEGIQERLDTLESKRAVRKDAVVMVQCLVTSDHDFFKDMPAARQREFFEQSLAFITDRYGKENILSATVHMDEKTPHMHVNFTPIRDRRLTAKTIFDRNELRGLQTDFHASVGQSWGLNRGESREEKRKHLKTEDFKLDCRRQELEQKAQQLLPPVHSIFYEELKPRQIGSKLFGLSKEHELPHQVAARLNAEHVEPLQERLAMLPIMQKKVAKAEEREKEIASELDALEKYRVIFKGLTKEQTQALTSQAKEYQKENRLAAERAEAAKKIAAAREADRALVEQERPKVEARFLQLLNVELEGTREERQAKAKGYADEWAALPASEREEYKEMRSKAIRDARPAIRAAKKEKSRDMGHGR